ncbi:hypothetical protein [Actinocrinis sp.]|uniref:hypothetical protein n=1 Tax=Actinocrinis sp. TaxID=1920516 RepID=UPI002D5A34C5|nr:hypothetical protein [Actinocrinis sp.]HZP55094.1 hypothetical protein [Actinocrinis sp.]
MPRTAQTSHDTQALAPRGGGGGWLKALIVALVIAGLIAAAALWAVHKLGHLSIFQSSGCTVSSPAGSMSLDLEQAKNASTIAAVGVSMNVPSFGIEVALATARQESKLHNLDYGDRDSVGLFQQRPSQGWGTQAQILDPVYSTTKFYQALLNVSGWQNMSLTQAAQAVQKSGSPTAYAQWEQFATVLSAVFTGSAGAGLGCTLDGPTFPAQAKGAGALLTARGQAVVNELRTEFGSANVGKVDGIAADGRSFGVTVPSSISGTAASARGWAYANWAAAQAETMGIAQVSYGGKTWSASDGAAGWKADSSATAAAGPVHIVMVG